MRFASISILYLGIMVFTCGGFAQPADGLYRLSPGWTGKMVKGPDQERLHLGESIDLSDVHANCWSLNNSNDRFRLELDLPYDPSLSSGVVIVRGGKGFKNQWSGSSRNERSLIGFEIKNSGYAKVLTRFLNGEVQMRRHPNHQFLVTFELSGRDKEISPDDEAIVSLRIKNVGENIVTFHPGGRNRGSRNNQYVFAGTVDGRPLVDHGNYMHFGGLSLTQQLEPGESYESNVDLKDWFLLDQPGDYTIYGSYYLRFIEPAKPGKIKVDKTIWEDFVTGSFSFRVAEPSALE